MSLECQNCGKELPGFPKEEVEGTDGEIEEIVQHTVREEEGRGWASALTDYFCNPECFINAKGDDQ